MPKCLCCHCSPPALVLWPSPSTHASHHYPLLVCHRCLPLLSATTAIIVAALPSPPSIATPPCPFLLSSLVCGCHPCYIWSAIAAAVFCLRQTSLPSFISHHRTFVAAAVPPQRQSLLASTVTSHPPVPPTLACSCHCLCLSSSISLRLLQSSFTRPLSYLNLVDCCIVAIFQCFLTSQNVVTGNIVGNPAATKTGGSVTC